MLPIQFILLLLIALMPGEMRAVDAAGNAVPVTTPPDMHFATLAMVSLVLSHALLALAAILQTRRALRKIHEPSSSPTAVAARTDFLFFWCRMATLAVTAVHLFSTPLPAAVFYWRDRTQVLRHIPLIAEVGFLLPAVLTWLVLWACGYYIETAARERAMPFRLAQAMPVHEMPPLGSFLLLQVRHNFFPFLFVFFLTVVDQFSGTSTAATVCKSVVSLAIMVAGLPLLLTKVWSTTSLVGPLRQRLDRVAKLYRLRFRNILLWRTHNLMINAAILGWIPGARYFLMSDSLLETLSDRQLEAVFAHEVGHGVHWHIPWYIGAFGGAFLLAGGVSGLALYASPTLAAHPETAGTIVMFAMLIVAGGGAIALIAPQFEHQADWFACRHMARMLIERPEPQEVLPAAALPDAGISGALATVPTPAEQLSLHEYRAGNYAHSAPETVPMQPALVVPAPVLSAMDEGTEIFVSALDNIVETSHKARNRRGFMHPSINKRIDLLRLMARDEIAEETFLRRMFVTRAAIAALVIAGAATIIGAALLPDPAASTVPPAPASQTAPAAHAPATGVERL